MKHIAAMPSFIYDFPVYWTSDIYEDTLRAGHFTPRGSPPPSPGKTAYPRSPSPRAGPSAARSRPRPRRAYTMNIPSSTLPEQPPWAHVAQTYACVLDQSFAEMARKNEETVRWIMEQQRRDMLRAVEAAREAMAFVHNVAAGVRADAETAAGAYRFEEMWTTPVDARWRRDAEETVQEELRRLKQARRNTERCRKAFERWKTEEDEMERRQTEALQKSKERRKQMEKQLFATYESRWAAIAIPSTNKYAEPLTFRSIPWPMFVQPKTIEDITPGRITLFLLSLSHSEGQSRKERIKAALRRWHPDRFGRWLARAEERDIKKVEEGAGIVVRCLNDLLGRDEETA